MAETTVDRKLFEIFGEAFELYNSFETCQEPTNSTEVQVNVKRCIKSFEDCTRLVSICGLFSSNESYTELPASDLKYLLLPFFLGQLSQKLCGGSRADIVEVSEVYFKDFLKRANDYGFEGAELGPSNAASSAGGGDQMAALTQTVVQRNQKLEKYRQKKELQDEISKLKILIKQETVDDDVEREFYVKLLKLSIMDAHEELSSIGQEKQILEFQKQRKEMMPKELERKAPPPKPLRPVIITKDLAQKAVYGLGYPSLPTMTVAEFYDDRVRQKIFPDAKAVQKSSTIEERVSHIDGGEESIEDIRTEEKLDKDDDYELARLRAKDEYKDDHRRGEGNRYNRS